MLNKLYWRTREKCEVHKVTKIYGYARISTHKQNIERQVRNIKAVFPMAIIIKEIYTGTKFQGRNELNKLLRLVESGDIIVFDSVSRMSRDAEEGFLLYEELFYKGIELVFLKEPHINAEVYRKAIRNQIDIVNITLHFFLKDVRSMLPPAVNHSIAVS